ncbi:MAG: M14 family metallopeptidase [Pseudobdellovibrionaceae bacterium]
MKKLGLFILLISTQVFAGPMVGRKYQSVVETMQNLERTYPQNVEMFELGVSDSGKSIVGIKVGNGAISNLLVATHHGNEYGSTEVAIGFAESVAAEPIQGQTLYIIPVLNIVGYDSRNRHESSTTGWHDANRDYPGPCGTDGPHNLKSTKMLAEFVDKMGIVASATIHTSWPAVVYPWGISTNDIDTPYTDIFKVMANNAVYVSKYTAGNSTAVIYPADGTFEDYAFWKHGVWSMLFEVGYSHSPNQKAVEELVRVNTPGLRKMFAEAPSQRAADHEFRGHCNIAMKLLDRRDE